jgi:hypothetical protein
MGVLPISEAGLRMFVLIDPDGNLLRCIDNLYQASSATTSGVASVLGAPRQLRGLSGRIVSANSALSEMFQQIKVTAKAKRITSQSRGHKAAKKSKIVR